MRIVSIFQHLNLSLIDFSILEPALQLNRLLKKAKTLLGLLIHSFAASTVKDSCDAVKSNLQYSVLKRPHTHCNQIDGSIESGLLLRNGKGYKVWLLLSPTQPKNYE